LNPDVGFGTLEEGKRADLIITLNNPLESVDHVKRPLGVMARGRFWSQTYLEAELIQQSIVMEQQKFSDPQNSPTESLDFSPHH
jgi:hypothetical protein